MKTSAIKALPDYGKYREQLLQQGLDETKLNSELFFATQLVANTPTIDAASVLTCIVNLCFTGLTLNPIHKQAYLIPFNEKVGNDWIKKASIMPSYMGLAHLAFEAGIVKSLNAQLVYKDDEFSFDMTDPKKPFIHKGGINAFASKKDENIVGVYCIASMPDGTVLPERMGLEEIYEIRNCSKSWVGAKTPEEQSKTVWGKNFGEMCRKTIVKRILKYLPKPANIEKIERLMRAIELDNQENGFVEPVTDVEMNQLDELLRRAEPHLGERQSTSLWSQLMEIEYKHQAQKMRSYLLQYQPKDLDEQFQHALANNQ